MSMPAFASRLSAAIHTSDTVLCVGLDPHPDLMPNAFGGPNQAAGTVEALSNLRNFCLCIIAAAKDRVPAIKPQAALFEPHGAGGMAVLAEIAENAREAGLLVIMDAKRGDIGSTAHAYASAWLGREAAFASDALTINPYLGMDSLEPFFAQAADTKSGLFVLVRTSNKGSKDIQRQNLAEGDGKRIPVYKHLAHLLSPYIEGAMDTETGLSNIGIVAGATGPSEAHELRKLLPSALFLIPGYGAQGASAADACSGLIQKIDGGLTGGLVNASRAITHNFGVQEATSPEAAKQAMIEAIDIAKQELAQN